MADDVQVDNGTGTDYIVDTTELGGTHAHVQHQQLVTAANGDTAAAKLAQLIGSVWETGKYTLGWGVRNDASASLSGVDDGEITVNQYDSLGRLKVVLEGNLAMPGAKSTSDAVSAVRVGDSIMWGGISYAPQHFTINQAAADGAAVVSLTSLQKIVLVSVYAIAASAVTIKWVSSTSNTSGAGTPTDLCPAMSFAANTGPNQGPSEYGHVITAAGSALKIVLGGSVQVSGFGTYIKVP